MHQWKYYFLSGLFNPWLNVNICACQYFSFSQKTLSMPSSFCTETFSINCTCKYSNLLAEEQQTLRRWFAIPHLTLPVFTLLLWILNLSLKPVVDPAYCLPQHFQDMKEITVFTSLLWILNLSLKPVADPAYCLPQHFQDMKKITFLLSRFP